MKKPVSVLFSYSLVALAEPTRPLLTARYRNHRVFSPSIAWRDTDNTDCLLLWLSQSGTRLAVIIFVARKFFFHPITREFLFLGEAIKSLAARSGDSQPTKHLERRLRIYRSHNMRDLGNGERETLSNRLEKFISG